MYQTAIWDTEVRGEHLTKAVEKPEDDSKHILAVNFFVSQTPLMIVEGTHRECLAFAKKMIEFIRAEHDGQRTGIHFKETMFGTDVIQLHAEDLSKVAPYKKNIKLWAVFTIKPSVISKTYIPKLEEK